MIYRALTVLALLAAVSVAGCTKDVSETPPAPATGGGATQPAVKPAAAPSMTPVTVE